MYVYFKGLGGSLELSLNRLWNGVEKQFKIPAIVIKR